MMELHKPFPKTLVISNNPLSDTLSNGKTIASLFRGVPQNKLMQLYFSPSVPDSDVCESYLRAYEGALLKKLCNPSRAAWQTVMPAHATAASVIRNQSTFRNAVGRSLPFRIARELLWKICPWKEKKLAWAVLEFNPEVIFFCAGDTAFSYDIVDYLKQLTNARTAVFITDDYILPRQGDNLIGKAWRRVIEKRMTQAVAKSSVFFTISDEMRRQYGRIFGKDSQIIRNTPVLPIAGAAPRRGSSGRRDEIKLIYAGGLYFGRWKTLREIAQAIESTNKDSDDYTYKLDIYSNGVATKQILDAIEVSGASEFLGGVSGKEIYRKLLAADVLVFVESFENESIESTRLSFSTKIPEYMSMGKPVLAVGPGCVASMKYLSAAAYCVTDHSAIGKDVRSFLVNAQEWSEVARRCKDRYLVDFNEEKQLHAVQESIRNLVATC